MQKKDGANPFGWHHLSYPSRLYLLPYEWHFTVTFMAIHCQMNGTSLSDGGHFRCQMEVIPH